MLPIVLKSSRVSSAKERLVMPTTLWRLPCGTFTGPSLSTEVNRSESPRISKLWRADGSDLAAYIERIYEARETLVDRRYFSGSCCTRESSVYCSSCTYTRTLGINVGPFRHCQRQRNPLCEKRTCRSQPCYQHDCFRWNFQHLLEVRSARPVSCSNQNFITASSTCTAEFSPSFLESSS
jgi:hypothetical protein